MTERQSSALLVQHVGSIRVIDFTDETLIDQAAIAQIGRELEELAAQMDDPRLIINFATVKHISSAMLGVLVSLHKKITARQGHLALAAIRPEVMEVFTMTGLDALLIIYRNTDEALAHS